MNDKKKLTPNGAGSLKALAGYITDPSYVRKYFKWFKPVMAVLCFPVLFFKHINKFYRYCFVGAALAVLIFSGLMLLVLSYAIRKRLTDQISERFDLQYVLKDFENGIHCLNGQVILGERYVFIRGSREILKLDEITSYTETDGTVTDARGSTYSIKVLSFILYDGRTIPAFSYIPNEFSSFVGEFLPLFEKRRDHIDIQQSEYIKPLKKLSSNDTIIAFLFKGYRNVKKRNYFVYAALLADLILLILGCLTIISIAYFFIALTATLIGALFGGIIDPEPSKKFVSCYLSQMKPFNEDEVIKDFTVGVRFFDGKAVLGEDHIFVKDSGRIVNRKDVAAIKTEDRVDPGSDTAPPKRTINVFLSLRDSSRILILENTEERLCTNEIAKLRAELRSH